MKSRFAILLLLNLAFSCACATTWRHLELGAGNYGADGHTKISQQMTVLQKLKATSARNYVDDLPEKDSLPYDPEVQYRILFDTLDNLVARFGDNGIFHVNDLYEEYATFAAAKLTDYAHKRGYKRVLIDVIPGDYENIDPSLTLGKHGKALYDTVHLKNPEVSFYYDVMDGNDLSSSSESRANARRVLQKLAQLSHEGLYFFPISHKYFVPEEEMADMRKGIFYEQTESFEAVPYYFPEGQGKIIPKQMTRVFFIPRKDPATADRCPPFLKKG